MAKGRKGRFWWPLVVGVGLIVAVLLYRWLDPQVPKVESFEERVEKVDSLIRGTLLSLGLEEEGEPVPAIPYVRSYMVPPGVPPGRVVGALETVLEDLGYPASLTTEEGEGQRVVTIYLEGVLSHLLYLDLPKIPRARVAIVIDDVGHNLNIAKELMDLPVTLSILPYRPYSREIAEEAWRKGRELLLHLPMEPKDPDKDPGRGALLTTMSEEEVRRRVEENLRSIPYIKGINNHMGSRFSEEKRLMEVILEEVKERGLYFFDSKTTANSTGYSLARRMGLRAIERDVFIDNRKDVEYIKEQLKRLIDIAKRKGHGVAIGHPHPSTVRAIKEMLPLFREEGIEVVPLSSLLQG